MEKEFITYEQALALKELGFDEPCLYYYKREKDNKFHLYQDDLGRWYKNTDVGEALLIWGEKYDTKQCSAPLYQQTFRWFRDKCDLQHTITWNKHYPKTPYEWEVRKTWRDELLRPYGIGGMSATYEEAESECLNKLIQLVKTNEQ